MELDKNDIYEGRKFIAGVWEADYVVNAFSNNLAHIPAAEFKSEDGRDLTSIRFTFNADNTVMFYEPSNGQSLSGTWEQTERYEYRCDFDILDQIEDGFFKENVQTFSVQDGCLVFAIGFLAIALKKTEDFDVGPSAADILTNAPDDGMTGIEGRYGVFKAISSVGDDFGFFTRAEVEADLKKRIEAGTCDESEAEEALSLFGSIVEFTAGRKVIMWMKVPEGVSDEEMKEALEAGEVKAIKDGYFYTDESEYKSVDGKFYYNSGAEYELFDEKQSPWIPLEFDEEGLLNFTGMLKLKRI